MGEQIHRIQIDELKETVNLPIQKELYEFETKYGLFKKTLNVSSEGICYGNQFLPLDQVTLVGWGIQRRMVNLVIPDSIYRVFWGRDLENLIELDFKVISKFEGFTNALWNAVCIPLMRQYLARLHAGEEINFFNLFSIRDTAIQLPNTRSWSQSSMKREYFSWSAIEVAVDNGRFVMRAADDKKFNVSLTYFGIPNVHIWEPLIRLVLQYRLKRLSDIRELQV